MFFHLQPPPPELGYSISVKDLDEEKITALNKIQKILETAGEWAAVLRQYVYMDGTAKKHCKQTSKTRLVS